MDEKTSIQAASRRRCTEPSPALVAPEERPLDPKITFETCAHLVPGYLQEQIDRLPKLEKFAASVLQAPPRLGGSFNKSLIPA